jgi:L-asparaginase
MKLYAEGFDANLMDNAVANGAKGLVILGPGAGQISTQAMSHAVALMARGIPVIVSTRPITGASPPTPYETGV